MMQNFPLKKNPKNDQMLFLHVRIFILVSFNCFIMICFIHFNYISFEGCVLYYYMNVFVTNCQNLHHFDFQFLIQYKRGVCLTIAFYV